MPLIDWFWRLLDGDDDSLSETVGMSRPNSIDLDKARRESGLSGSAVTFMVDWRTIDVRIPRRPGG